MRAIGDTISPKGYIYCHKAIGTALISPGDEGIIIARTVYPETATVMYTVEFINGICKLPEMLSPLEILALQCEDGEFQETSIDPRSPTDRPLLSPEP